MNILRKILWKNVLNIRTDIVGGRLSQIVVERCPLSGSSSLRAKKETTDAKKSQLCKFDVSRGWVGDWWTPWLGCEGNRDLTQEQVVYTTTTTRRGRNGALDTSVMLAPRSLRQPSKSRSLSDQSVYRAVFSCILALTNAA